MTAFTDIYIYLAMTAFTDQYSLPNNFFDMGRLYWSVNAVIAG